MSDPVRLLASPDTTDLERELLQSWDDERPSSAARDKTLALLGVTGGAIVAGGAAVGGSIAPKAVAAGWLAMAKWTIVSVVALSAIGLGVGYAVRHRAPETHAIAIAQHVAPAEVTPPIATNNAVIELPQTTDQNTTTAHVAPSRPVASASLNDQIAALDHARAALTAGDASRAKKLVDAYESEYPGGAFTQEAEVVRIDALVHEGNHDGAERAGKHFLAAYPKSPHAGRVRALLGYDP